MHEWNGDDGSGVAGLGKKDRTAGQEARETERERERSEEEVRALD
jgi:hypothetical protein